MSNKNIKQYYMPEGKWIDINDDSTTILKEKKPRFYSSKLFKITSILLIFSGISIIVYFSFITSVKAEKTDSDKAISTPSDYKQNIYIENSNFTPTSTPTPIITETPSPSSTELITSSSKSTNKSTSLVKSTSSITTSPQTSSITASKIPINATSYNFETSTQGWVCSSFSLGPLISSEWKSKGSYSLKGIIDVTPNSKYTLDKVYEENYSGGTNLNATVYSTGVTGLSANLFILTLSSPDTFEWIDTGRFELKNSPVTLSLSLKSSSISNVRRIGIEFNSDATSNGKANIYLDNVYVN